MKTFAVLVLALALGGCATSGYRQFYQPVTPPPPAAAADYLDAGEAPQVIRTTPEAFATTVQQYRSRGYALLGTSFFNGRRERPGQAADQARELKATVVVLATRYTDTEIAVVPTPVLTSDIVYGSGIARIDGRPAPFRGSFTTFGTLSVPVTTQVRLYDHQAAYLVKLNRLPASGLVLTGLTPALRKAYERNTGAVVEVVLEDSPAFLADVLEGDLLTAVDGQAVRSPEAARAALEAAGQRGGAVVLQVLRDKQPRTLTLTLPAP